MGSATGAESAAAGRPEERRAEVRYSVMVPGTLVRRNGAEIRCVTENASASGFEIIANASFRIGEEVSLLLHHLDRLDLEVKRITPRGFGGRIIRASMARDAFLRQLNWLIDGQAGLKAEPGGGRGTIDNRRHQRHVPTDRATTVQLMGQQPVPARLIDVSQSGAAVESHLSVFAGRRILLGKRPSRVVRVFSGGFAVEFDTPLEARRPAEVAGPLTDAGQSPLFV